MFLVAPSSSLFLLSSSISENNVQVHCEELFTVEGENTYYIRGARTRSIKMAGSKAQSQTLNEHKTLLAAVSELKHSLTLSV